MPPARSDKVTLKKPTMMCEGGPWHMWAYYLEDWEQRRIACEAIANPIASYYAPDMVDSEDGPRVRKELHPNTAGQLSERWVWRPPPEYDDPYKIKPVSDKRVELIKAVAALGRRGARISAIAAAMPWQCSVHQISGLVDELVREGVFEASSLGAGAFYRFK